MPTMYVEVTFCLRLQHAKEQTSPALRCLRSWSSPCLRFSNKNGSSNPRDPDRHQADTVCTARSLASA